MKRKQFGQIKKMKVEKEGRNEPVSCCLFDRHGVLVVHLKQLVERTVDAFEVQTFDDSIQVLESGRGVLGKKERGDQIRRGGGKGRGRKLTRSIMLARCCSEVRCSFFAWLTVDSSFASSLQSSLLYEERGQ